MTAHWKVQQVHMQALARPVIRIRAPDQALERTFTLFLEILCLTGLTPWKRKDLYVAHEDLSKFIWFTLLRFQAVKFWWRQIRIQVNSIGMAVTYKQVHVNFPISHFTMVSSGLLITETVRCLTNVHSSIGHRIPTSLSARNSPELFQNTRKIVGRGILSQRYSGVS